MPETEKKAPRVINKSGTLKMDDKTAATKQTRDISGKRMDRRNRRDRVRAEAGPKEFDEISKIILNQNDAHYDGRYISPDVKELMNEYYKVKYSNTRSPSLEEKKAFITSKTGIDINTINEMTYRYFDLVYSSSVNNDLYFAQKMVQCSYKYDVKEDVRHPLFEPPKDPYAEIFEDTGILGEKGISGADKLNAQNAQMMLEN